MFRILTGVCLSLILAALAFSDTIYIPSQYPTIQAGMEAAENGDTVLVSPGTYNESVDFIYKAIVLISDQGASNTIIDPNANATGVFMYSSEGPMVIEGFTITNSYTSSPINQVHGIFCGDSSIIRNNIIINIGTYWSYSGAGIKVGGGCPLIEDNVISNNTCVYEGAGIKLYRCDGAVIRNNNISGNAVHSGYGEACGGGIYVDNSDVLIEKNIFSENWAHPEYGHGGAIYISDSSQVQIFNNTFYENELQCIEVVDWYNSTQVEILNNVIVNTNGYGIVSGSSSLSVLDYNDLYNNSQGNYFNCSGGEHDISADPLFLDPFNGDFHLTQYSPCIDAGDPNSPFDPDSTIADIGAFYYDQNVSVDDPALSFQPSDFELYPPYPNPFNASTTVSFALPKAGNVELVVYDILGREVMTVFEGFKPAGVHLVHIDGCEMSSGMYFMRLTGDGGQLATRKVILLK